MALQFLNPSRSYDADRHCTRFWGHDESVEVSFFLDDAAIFKLAPRTVNAETGILSAFDAARPRIEAAASKVYAPSRSRRFYVLAAEDF